MDFRLREILNVRGISIRTFAAQIGVTPNSLPVSRTYAPSLTAVQRYANALNIPSIELLQSPDIPTPVTDADMTDKFDINEMALYNIKRIAALKHLALKDIAQGAGISPQSLSLTLKKNKMTTTTIIKIARGMNVDPCSLLVPSVPETTSHDEAETTNTEVALLESPASNEIESIEDDETPVYTPGSVHERDKLIIQALFTDRSEAEKIDLIRYAQSLICIKEEKQESSEDDSLYGDTLSLNGN